MHEEEGRGEVDSFCPIRSFCVLQSSADRKTHFCAVEDLLRSSLSSAWLPLSVDPYLFSLPPLPLPPPLSVFLSLSVCMPYYLFLFNTEAQGSLLVRVFGTPCGTEGWRSPSANKPLKALYKFSERMMCRSERREKETKGYTQTDYWWQVKWQRYGSWQVVSDYYMKQRDRDR